METAVCDDCHAHLFSGLFKIICRYLVLRCKDDCERFADYDIGGSSH